MDQIKDKQLHLTQEKEEVRKIWPGSVLDFHSVFPTYFPSTIYLLFLYSIHHTIFQKVLGVGSNNMHCIHISKIQESLHQLCNRSSSDITKMSVNLLEGRRAGGRKDKFISGPKQHISRCALSVPDLQGTHWVFAFGCIASKRGMIISGSWSSGKWLISQGAGW